MTQRAEPPIVEAPDPNACVGRSSLLQNALPAVPEDLSSERMKRLEHGVLHREAVTMAAMIEIYCRAHHASVRPAAGGLCPDCEELKAYAMKRLACCPFGEAKPVCAKCRVHCYKPAMKEKVAAVMRYAGPRVVFQHPLLALEHLWKSLTVTPPEKPRARARSVSRPSTRTTEETQTSEK